MDSKWDNFRLAITWDQLHITKRRETVRYYAALVDISTDSEIARTNTREFSYSRSLFGKIEVAELAAGPLETTGHLPQPPKPAAETAPVPVAAPRPALARAAAPAKASTPARAPAAPAVAAPPTAPAAPDGADLPPAIGAFRTVRVVHNVTADDRSGMQVQADFRIRKRKGVRCKFIVYLLDRAGNPLKDMNRQYSTVSGDVCASCGFTPDQDDTPVRNLTVFIPYVELDLPDGEYDLQLSPKLYDEAKKVFLARYNLVPFHYSQNGDTVQGTFGFAESAKAPTTKKSAAPKSTTKKTTKSVK